MALNKKDKLLALFVGGVISVNAYAIHSTADLIEPEDLGTDIVYEIKEFDIASKLVGFSNLQPKKFEYGTDRYEVNQVSAEEDIIKFYSRVYGLDYEMVYDILYEKTDGFVNHDYLENLIIGESVVKGHVINCETLEEALLIAIRDIYYFHSKYGYGDEIYTGIEFVSNLTYEQQIGDISRILRIEPELTYAICKAESNFNSSMFNNKNNPSGIKFSYGWAVFPSKYAGFIEQAMEQVKYRERGVTSIAGIGAKHAPTNDSRNSNWVRNVTSIYKEALDYDANVFQGLYIPIEERKYRDL